QELDVPRLAMSVMGGHEGEGTMDPKPVDRDQIIEAIRRATEPRADAHSLFEGGSAAFGRVDAWSEVDLEADVDDGTEEAVFAAIDAALGAPATITTRWLL